MKLKDILVLPECRVLSQGNPEREISSDGVWVTVMGNRNTLAVASLTDTACIVLAEGVALDEDTLLKAAEEGIAVLSTEQPAFDIALKIYQAGLS